MALVTLASEGCMQSWTWVGSIQGRVGSFSYTVVVLGWIGLGWSGNYSLFVGWVKI